MNYFTIYREIHKIAFVWIINKDVSGVTLKLFKSSFSLHIYQLKNSSNLLRIPII